MTPALGGVSHLAFSVPDLAEAARFWVEALGFEPVNDDPQVRFLAAATPKRSPGGSGSVQPTAACSAPPWRAVSADRWGRSANTRVTRPAWASTASAWTPWTQTVVHPSPPAVRADPLQDTGPADQARLHGTNSRTRRPTAPCTA